MGWTNEQINQFQMDNNKALAEINATLRPDPNLSGKIGIFCQGQAGDLATCMSVLAYRDQIFSGKHIIWYVNWPNADLLRYAPISEVRPWPWAGNGLPEGCPDYYPVLCNENNRLNVELAKQYPGTADLEDGFFPAPHQLSVEKRHGLDYPNVSKKIFGVPDDWQWHPYLCWSDKEKEDVINNYTVNKSDNRKRILFETFAGSGQSILDEEMVMEIINKSRQLWKDCWIVFASHKFLRENELFPQWLTEQKNISFLSELTIRQCALVVSEFDIMISVSSGITVATSAWGLKPLPTIQFCGSDICGTKSLSTGEMIQVFADNKITELSKKEFYQALESLIIRYS